MLPLGSVISSECSRRVAVKPRSHIVWTAPIWESTNCCRTAGHAGPFTNSCHPRAPCHSAGYADKTKVKVNRLLGQLRGALLRAGDLASCEQVRRARVPILKVRRL
jgi:hypothetical protein